MSKCAEHKYFSATLSEPEWWGQPSPLRLRDREPAKPISGRQGPDPVAFPADWKRKLSVALCLGLFSVMSYLLVNRFNVPTILVQDSSMPPTLEAGNRFVLNRWSYFRQLPRRGDLVAVNDSRHENYQIKRVIAKPSESVYFKDGTILVNGEYLSEPYLPAGTPTFLPECRDTFLVLGRDRYLVLANSGSQKDQCLYDAVDRADIVGAVFPENLK